MSNQDIKKDIKEGATKAVDEVKKIDFSNIHSMNYVSGLLTVLLIFICIWQIADIICKRKMEKWLKTFQYLEQISNEKP